MNRFISAIFALILAWAGAPLPLPAAGTGRGECRTLPSKILGHPVAYCALLPPSYDSDKRRRYPVLYLLHGLGQNEQMLVGTGGWNLVEDLWEENRIGEFLIITPAADASFDINSRDGRVFFLQEFIPGIENRYRTKPGREERGIAGISMGGYGSLHLAFRHPRLFGSVSAHSAALMEKLPTVSAGAEQQSPRLRMLGHVFGFPPDRAFWDSNNPLEIARTANLAGLAIYFDCGSEDSYGFYGGAKALDKTLTARRIPHEFHIYPGGHDWTYFAQHLPESLEFHSRVFGLTQAATQSGLR
jgi:S-formylglutathione hydrolase FrmB